MIEVIAERRNIPDMMPDPEVRAFVPPGAGHDVRDSVIVHVDDGRGFIALNGESAFLESDRHVVQLLVFSQTSHAHR